MGLLDKLLNKNPTADWQGDRRLVLELDIEQESLSGVKIGDPLHRLTRFGPTDDAKGARGGWYRYMSLGFAITTEHERVVEIELGFDPVEHYRGAVRIKGNQLSLEGDVTEAGIVAVAGPPDERIVAAAPAARITLRYKREKADWQFEFEDGTLESIWGGKRD